MLRAMTAAFGAQPLQRIAAIAASTPPAGLRRSVAQAPVSKASRRA